jgi:predicted transposase YdaD
MADEDIIWQIVRGPNPWDTFFRVMLRTEGVCASLIEERLPEGDLVNLLPETCRLTSEFITDPTLRQLFADILIEVETVSGENGLAIIIGEHKSYYDKFVALQLAGYMVRFHEWFRSQECNAGKLLPRIFPVVVYHGKKKWLGSRRFSEIVDPLGPKDGCKPRLRPLDFEFLLVDVEIIPDDLLSKNPDLAAGLMTLKYGLRPELQAAALPAIARAIAKAPSLAKYIYALLLTYEGCPRELIYEELGKVQPKQRSGIMSIADQLWAEGETKGRKLGRTEGEKKGIAKGKADLLTDLLRHRFGSVPPSVSRRIRGADEPQIKAWGTRMLEAKTIDDVFTKNR